MPVVLGALTLAGCSRFVWTEEPFTPDPAPASEVIASGHDTTYVLRGASYYLLASQRSVLWQRNVMDDVAWRYRELFGEPPSRIAVRVDAAGVVRDTAWRGIPLAVVAPPRPGDERRPDDKRRVERAAHDSVAMRLLAGPLLAATAAQAWLAARATGAVPETDGEPAGGPARPNDRRLPLPAWLEAGALRILASPGAAMRAASEMRANSKRVMPLASLFSVQWPVPATAAHIVGIRVDARGDDDEVMSGSVTPARPTQERAGVPGVAPVFIAQSVTVLAFMRERDPSIVARLVDELPRGRSIPDVLARSATLPRDVAGLEAEWKKWVERVAKRR